MTDHPTPKFAPDTDNPLSLWLSTKDGLADLMDSLPERAKNWVTETGFTCGPGTVIVIPGSKGEITGAIGGLGTEKTMSRRRFVVGAIAAKLPKGTWKIETEQTISDATEAALGWLLAQYSFGRYKTAPKVEASLIAPDGVNQDQIEAIAAGECLTRDLINTPASDMGPDDLERECRDLAKQHNAQVKVVEGDTLLDENFPLIHTVGCGMKGRIVPIIPAKNYIAGNTRNRHQPDLGGYVFNRQRKGGDL